LTTNTRFASAAPHLLSSEDGDGVSIAPSWRRLSPSKINAMTAVAAKISCAAQVRVDDAACGFYPYDRVWGLQKVRNAGLEYFAGKVRARTVPPAIWKC
jgi:hypothetical protein